MFFREHTALALLSLLCCAHARADVFTLQSGGQVEGEWMNRDAPLKQPFRVKTADGLTLLLERSNVREVVYERPDEVRYRQLSPTVGDTVDDQWNLAQWCYERHLPEQREVHLRRILQLNPDHLPARRALGYAQVSGEWLTQDEYRRRQGLEEYRGRWRMPQEIAIIEERRKARLAGTQWMQRLRTLRDMLDTDSAVKARDELVAIGDPQAVEALAEMFSVEPTRPVKLIYVAALGNIADAASVRVLLAASLADPDMEVRVACLDQLERLDPPGVVAEYAKTLGSQNNFVINRAAYALARLGDESVAAPLIEALVTTHTFTYQPPQSGGPQTITTSFVNDARASTAGQPPLVPNTGSGLSMGQSKKTITRRVSNDEVLSALLKVSGAPNYGYNQQAWRQWLESRQNATATLDGQQ